MEKRVCSSCRETKPLAEFHKFGPNRERVGKWCEDCYQKNKARARKKPGSSSTTKA